MTDIELLKKVVSTWLNCYVLLLVLTLCSVTANKWKAETLAAPRWVLYKYESPPCWCDYTLKIMFYGGPLISLPWTIIYSFQENNMTMMKWGRGLFGYLQLGSSLFYYLSTVVVGFLALGNGFRDSENGKYESREYLALYTMNYRPFAYFYANFELQITAV